MYYVGHVKTKMLAARYELSITVGDTTEYVAIYHRKSLLQ